MNIYIGLISLVLFFCLNICGIVLSGQAISNLGCSEQLNIFFIGSIVALIALLMDLGSKYAIASAEDVKDENAFLRLGVFLIFTLVWACLGVGWIKNAGSCNTDIIRSANIVLSILFVNVGNYWGYKLLWKLK